MTNNPSETVAAEPHPTELVARKWVAIVALVATIFGAAVGGGATVFAAYRTSNAQLSIAKENFLRQQRVVFYSDFVQSIQTVKAKTNSLIARAKDPTSRTTNRIMQESSEYNDFNSALGDLFLACDNVTVAGSARLLKDGYYVQHRAMALQRSVEQSFAGLADGRPTASKLLSAMSTIASLVMFAENGLLADIRADLY